MRLSDFDFSLPPELIAQHPAVRRDASRLLHVRPDGSLADRRLRDLPDLLRAGDLLVLNDTRVIPARLQGRRGDATVEITLHQYQEDGWEAFAKRSKRLKSGDMLVFGEDFHAEILARHADGRVVLRFNDPDQLFAKLQQYGQMPLPPYIKRDAKQAEDDERYQTVYAQKEGAVAAPTAGLHFTEALLDALDRKGIGHCFVTLHVGGGTFLPVKTEDISRHRMHSEWLEITAQTAARINRARREGRRIVAVGTTSLRTLETAADESGNIQPLTGETAIFITPGYRFKVVDVLFTNFHLPKSTLFMLVSAFCGLETMQQAYQYAIAAQYRFFSYGDACLLERAK